MKIKLKDFILIIFCAYSLFFVVGSILAPVMAHFQQYELSGNLTGMYMFSCHQQPTRSFWLFGYPIALCSRCLGFYTGVVIFSLLTVFRKIKITLKSFIALFALVFVDILSNCVLNFNTGCYIRFIVGNIMGLLFVSAVYYLFGKKKEKKNYD